MTSSTNCWTRIPLKLLALLLLLGLTAAACGSDDEDTAGAAEDETARSGTMGRKAYIPYGLYVAHGFFVPSFAADTGFNDEDLELLWQALVHMWDLDRSASRGLTACRGLYVFSHDSKLGNAPAHKLLDRVRVKRRDEMGVARAFSDYAMTVDRGDLPGGVELHVLTEG